MKKLKLSLQNMEGVEVLTREQLMKVMGGDGGSGSGTGNGFCWIKPRGQGGVEIQGMGDYGISVPDPCPNASFYGNQRYVDLIATPGNGVYSCSYNCGC